MFPSHDHGGDQNPKKDSPVKSHPSPELDRLKKDVATFQKQYDEDPNEKTKKDLDWAKQGLEEYMSGAHGEGSPMKVVGSFIDGERVPYDKAMEAIESGEGDVELTNEDAMKYAREQAKLGDKDELSWIEQARAKDRQRVKDMTPEERKEHFRLIREDQARQANIDKLNWRENLGYGLTEKEKLENAGYGEGEKELGLRGGSYKIHGK